MAWRESQLDVYLPLLLKRAQQQQHTEQKLGWKPHLASWQWVALIMGTLVLAGLVAFARVGIG